MPDSSATQKKLPDYLVPRIIKWLLLLISMTCRKKWLGMEHLEIIRKSNGNWIYSLWHNNITYASLFLRNQKLIAMVSSSNDGSIAATVIELFGNKTVRGSSSRGGVKVLLAMIKGIRSGQIGAITPDGPRGPKYRLQNGVISISQKTSTPLVPIHFESTRQWIFRKSWDKHKFPKPFSTIVISIGPPFQVPEKLDKEQFEVLVKEFEAQMMANLKTAEGAVNQLKKVT